ncbi:MAG TPA: cyclase family protein [Verrucomicrobiae bacterium]|nr:cyclase family protein [Verrucomicrobiae bacterium]
MIYDLTPPIDRALKVFPGDTPPEREILLDMEAGAHLTLSTLRTTVHVGAHADAPSHYARGAASIEKRPLDLYLGPCQVLRLAARRGAVLEPDDLRGASIAAPRILLATGTFPDPTVFNEDFAALSPWLVDFLHERGARLVGVDTPSLDPCTSKDLPAHQACLRHDMAILEGLVLAHVPEGLYELIALPLPIAGADGSPVRAILRDLP